MVGRRKDGERRATGPLLATGVLLTGLLVTVLAAAGLLAAQRDRAERIMDQRHAVAVAAVRGEIGRYTALLETVAAGAATRTWLTWDDFDVATAPLADAELIGAAAVAYVVPVRAGQIAPAQQSWRDRGAEGLTLRPRGARPEHHFPVFVRPLTGTEVGMGGTEAGIDTETPIDGVDLDSAPELADVLAESRDAHATAVSDTYVLLSDRGRSSSARQQSFVFAAPVWTRANTPEFRGWMLLGLRGRTFLSGVLDTISQDHLLGELVATGSDGSEVTIADWSAPGDPDLTRSSPLDVGGRTWTLVTRADSGRLPGAGEHLPEVAVGGGLVLTGLLTWLVYALATGRARARAQVAVATDELRRADAESRRQAGLLGAVLTSISDGVTVVDENGRMLLETPAGKRMMGTTESNDHPQEWQRHYGVFRPDGVTPFPLEEMPLMRGLRGESTDGVEMLIRNPQRPEGVLLSVDGRPLDASAGQLGAVAVFRDVTELRRYETDLRVFAGVVAHDLKAPLALARGHAEVALDDVPQDSPVRGRLERVVRAVDRMDSMIDTLLAYTTARNAPLRLTPVELEPLIREVIEQRVAHREARWSVGRIPRVRADAAMVRHVLDNLVGNAIKYVPDGVVPFVEVSARAVAEGWVRVEVADAGIGIPDEEKPHVFESFHRTEAAAGYTGTGLGLAICKRIVERHGGEIGVADNPGGGSRFFFTLPGAPVEADEGETPDMSEKERDEAAVREALERALAERAAILRAARLPGLGVPEPAGEHPLRAPRPEPQRQD